MNISVCKVWFDNENMFVQLNDKRIISAPIDLYPRLRNATPQQRNEYELWNQGKWLHWEELDEDLSAEGLLSLKINFHNIHSFLCPYWQATTAIFPPTAKAQDVSFHPASE